MNDSVVLDQGAEGALGLVMAVDHRTLERSHRWKFLGQVGFVVPLGQVSVEITLGFADVGALLTLDVKWSWLTRIGWIDEILSLVLGTTWR